MLFDEPTSALDPEMVSEVLLVIRDLAHRGHDARLRDARDGLRPRSRGPHLLHGRGEDPGTRDAPEEFFERPQHPRTKQFPSDLRSPFAGAQPAGVSEETNGALRPSSGNTFETLPTR